MVALLFLLLPIGAKYYLIDWLEKNGADSASIKKLRYNPFLGRITLAGLEVEKGGKSRLHDSSMVLDFGITSLFNHDIRLEKVEYRDLSIDLEQYEDGRWRFASYTMQGGTGETEVKAEKEKGSNWAFRADRVILENCRAHFKTPDIEMTLVVVKAELNRFTTRQGQPAGTLSFIGQLDDSPIVLQLDHVQVAPELRINGNILVSKFELGELSGLLNQVVPTFSGEAGLDGKIRFSQTAKKGIQVDYDGMIKVGQLDIGNNDLITSADSLWWEGTVQYGGPENAPATIETNGLLAARDYSLDISGIKLAMAESRIDFTGKTSLIISNNIMVEHEGSLLLEDVKLAFPPYDFTEKSALWKGTILFDSDHNKKGPFVSANGSLDLGLLSFQSGEQSTSIAFGSDNLSWQGVFEYGQQDSQGESFISVDGAIAGDELSANLSEQQLQIGQGKVALATQSTISFGKDVGVSSNSSLTLEQFRLLKGDDKKPLVFFEKMAVADLRGRGGKTIVVKDITTTGLKLSISGDFPLEIESPEIQLSDLFTKDLATFKVAGLSLKKALVTAIHNNRELVSLDSLVMNDVNVDDKVKINAGNAQVSSLTFLASEDSAQKPALSLGSTTLTDIIWSGEDGLQGETLRFDDLVTAIVRDKDGNINISKDLRAMQRPLSESAAEMATTSANEQASKGAPLKLGEIIVGGKSAFFFEDYTLAVPFITDFQFSQFKVTDIDSSLPDKESNIILTGEFEKRAPLEVTGFISPFKNKLAMKLKLKLKNYPLSSLSAYTVQTVGTAMASGQLKLKTKITLADDELDMNNTIVLKKLETETISVELAEELNNELPIPLDAALSILRDGKRNITLDIPLKGPLSELDVGISDVLIKGLSTAIIPAAAGYLTYALGPYAALAYVGLKVGEKLLQVDLPPVEFVQQEKTLLEEHVKYLERIAMILIDRPETDIQICPRVASWEFLSDQEKLALKVDVIEVDEKNRQKLLQLGQQRATAIQDHLADKYSIEHNRLLICDTRIEKEKSTVPAVLLQL